MLLRKSKYGFADGIVTDCIRDCLNFCGRVQSEGREEVNNVVVARNLHYSVQNDIESVH